MSLSMRLAALTFIFSFISHQVYGLVIPNLVKREQLCNGYAGLCDRSYGNITTLGAHDSFAASGNPFALARTQEVDVDAQLSMGVRMLQVQAHMNRKHLHFCHTSCSLFDGGKVSDYFTRIKLFLDRHPNEVITIIIANPEKVSGDVWQPIFESTGLEDMAYVPPNPTMMRQDWPTLKEMLDDGKRIVVFMDKEADDDDIPYLLPQFDLMWEDKYDPTDDTFPCAVDRTTGDLTPSQQLNLINHNLNDLILPFGEHGFTIPKRLASPRTNSVHWITKHAEACSHHVNNQNPNFVLVDFVNVGDAARAVARLNGFPYWSTGTTQGGIENGQEDAKAF